MISKITYENKEAIQNDASVPTKNKVMDTDMNEIKQVVNDNADELNTAKAGIKQLQNNQGTSSEDITNLNNRVNSLEKDNTNNKSNISNLQKGQTTQEQQIENLNKQYTQLNKEIQTANENIDNIEKSKADKAETEEQFQKISADQERQDKEINALKIEETTEKQKVLHIEDSSNLPAKINIFGNSEQEVRSGKNKLNINSEELYRTASTTVEIKNNTINTTSNNNPVTSYVSIPIEVKANTDYAFSGVAKVVSNTITDAVSVYAKVRNEKNGGSWISGGQATINKDSTANQDLNLTFNSGNNTTVWLWLYIKSSGVSGIISIDFSNLQVEEGTTKTDYEEYGVSPSPKFPSKIKNVGDNCGNIEINKTNSNILPQFEETKETQTINGVTITKNSDGTYNLNGTSTGIVDLILFGSWTSEGVKLRLNKGILYFKTNSTKINGSINCFSKSINKSFSINVNSYFDNQVVEDVSYVFIRLCTGARVTFNNENVILELSYDDVDNLEVNKDERIVFPLSEGQRLMLRDYIGTGEKIHHARKQIVLDGTENIQLRSENDDGTYTYSLSTIIDYKHTQNMQAICTHFKNLGTTISVASMKTKGIGFSFYYNAGVTTSALYLNTTIETVEKLKAWLAEQKQEGTPVVIEYELAEEETEDFTEEQKTAYEQLRNCNMYKLVTNITTEENMALIEAEYTADTKTYIDNKTANMQKQLNIINELLSTTSTSAKLLDNLKSDLEREVL